MHQSLMNWGLPWQDFLETKKTNNLRKYVVEQGFQYADTFHITKHVIQYEENDSEGENPIASPCCSSSLLSTSSAVSMLAPRPKGKKKAKQDLEQLVLQSRQIAATEELTRVTKKKVEAMEKSNEIDIMLAKTSDITTEAKEYIEIMQAAFLAKVRREQEAELAGQDM